MAQKLISIVVPLYNEASGLENFHRTLTDALKKATNAQYEVIYVDDGSDDVSDEVVNALRRSDERIKLLKLTRNFGKENALSAGIAQAKGQAILMLDGDGQHPAELIPEFIGAWRDGARVVVGVRRTSSGDSWLNRSASQQFYKLFNRLSKNQLIPHSTDFRLIDRAVQQEFLRLEETDRLTRGLIDWLGFKRQLIYFDAPKRRTDSPGYSRGKLMRLATHSFVSMTPVPLYIFGYLGVFITGFSLLLGAAVFIEQILLADPWHWKFSGTAMIGILLLFLVGIVLLSQGILSLYISHIHAQTKKRPLYIIDREGSIGLEKP